MISLPIQGLFIPLDSSRSPAVIIFLLSKGLLLIFGSVGLPVMNSGFVHLKQFNFAFVFGYFHGV